MNERIGFISSFPPPLAGMAIQALHTIDILRREGNTVYEIPTNPLITRRYKLNQLFRLFVFYYKLVITLPKIETLIIYSNHARSFYTFTLLPIILARALGKRIIVEFKSGGTPAYNDKWGSVVYPFLKLVDYFIEPSEFIASHLRENGFRAKVVPDVIRLSDFSNEPRAEPGGCTLIVSRNLDDDVYGIDVILKAFPLIKSEIPSAELWILGIGPLRDELEGLSRDLMGEDHDSVKFPGYVERDEVRSLYKRADIMVNASREDNTPNSLYEAMAEGLPIVTTSVCGIKYIIRDGETGLFFEMDNPTDLAEKVIELYNDGELYRTLSRNGVGAVRELVWDYEREGLSEMILRFGSD